MTVQDQAAAAWGGTIHRLITHRENAVYEMRLPDGGRAALRLHRKGYQTAAAIASELWWCDALAQAGVAVSSPLRNREGDILLHLPSGDHASAIAWVDGAPLGAAALPLAGTREDQARRYHAVGRLLAQVHRATDRLTLPQGFERPRWDINGLAGEAPLWGRFWEHPAASPEDVATLRAARDHLAAALSSHAKTGDFGLIHADVFRENLFVNGESLTLIDFDDSGFGFRLYDLGTALCQNLYEPHFPDLRAALIEGYGSGGDLVDTFILARTLASVGWTMPRLAAHDPIHRSHIARAVMWARRVMR